ncbi:hypothetical protein K435DRAFT_963017 [Dendrothele bispora CBS 962.96]|uniref:Uncharacterized protein n=1 Tax=Dendrothele bispora (strain CBS 962.96) TaxID=1314807 RepID=A0A4S8MID7_DENBC|nr:hypothetical protein K435DRAFT_963017 [Dendrothele bispora CBS 962.96]
MGRAFYTPSTQPSTVDPYPKWSNQRPFDPDSDDFFKDAIFEAFLDTNECLHPDDRSSPMADGPDDPAQMIADALQRPPSSSSSNSDEDGPPTPITIPTYIYDIPPTAALPSLSSLARQQQRLEPESHVNDPEGEPESDTDAPLIRFQLPITTPSTPPQRSRAIPIPAPTSTGSAYRVHASPYTPYSASGSYIAYSPPPSISPRIYNWSRTTATSASPFSRFHAQQPRVISASTVDR